MSRELLVYIEDILESINKIEEYTKSITQTNFWEDYKVQDAVIRRLEIIGEAVNNIPEEFRIKYKDIPWKSIAGMRDVKEDLPPLKSKLAVIMRELKN